MQIFLQSSSVHNVPGENSVVRNDDLIAKSSVTAEGQIKRADSVELITNNCIRGGRTVGTGARILGCEI